MQKHFSSFENIIFQKVINKRILNNSGVLYDLSLKEYH